MKNNRKVSEDDLIIRFSNPSAAEHFAAWLSGAGEQQYWEWMACRESEESGDITAKQFHYHGEEDLTKERNDPERYGEFMADNIIRTTMGRLKK